MVSISRRGCTTFGRFCVMVRGVGSWRLSITGEEPWCDLVRELDTEREKLSGLPEVEENCREGG